MALLGGYMAWRAGHVFPSLPPMFLDLWQKVWCKKKTCFVSVSTGLFLSCCLPLLFLF